MYIKNHEIYAKISKHQFNSSMSQIFPLKNNHIVCLNQYTHLTHLKINIFIKCLPKKFETEQSVFKTFQDDQNNIPGSLDHAYAVAYCSSIGVRIIREVSSRRSQTKRRRYEFMS